MEPYRGVICDELNVKELSFLDDASSLQSRYLTLNFKKAGAVLKGDLQKVKNLLDTADQAAVVASYDAGAVQVAGYDSALAPELFVVTEKPLAHIAITSENDLTVALDTSLDDALIAEGTYRELLRQCQVLRRDFGFRVEQHIRLAVTTSDTAVAAVLEKYRDQLADETLADEISLSAKGYANQKTVTAGNADVAVEMETV